MKLRNLFAIICTVTASSIMSMGYHRDHKGFVLSTDGTGNLSWTSAPAKSPYDIWLEHGAKIDKLSEREIFEFTASAVGNPQHINEFNNLLKLLRKADYEKIFTSEVLYNALVANNVKGLELLIQKLAAYNNHNVMQKLIEELNKYADLKKTNLKLAKEFNWSDRTYEKDIEFANKVKSIINQENQKTKILMTRPKGDTTFSFQ